MVTNYYIIMTREHVNNNAEH